MKIYDKYLWRNLSLIYIFFILPLGFYLFVAQLFSYFTLFYIIKLFYFVLFLYLSEQKFYIFKLIFLVLQKSCITRSLAWNLLFWYAEYTSLSISVEIKYTIMIIQWEIVNKQSGFLQTLSLNTLILTCWLKLFLFFNVCRIFFLNAPTHLLARKRLIV